MDKIALTYYKKLELMQEKHNMDRIQKEHGFLLQDFQIIWQKILGVTFFTYVINQMIVDKKIQKIRYQ